MKIIVWNTAEWYAVGPEDSKTKIITPHKTLEDEDGHSECKLLTFDLISFLKQSKTCASCPTV